ncbi:MAG: hypothetical protein AAGF15_09540 [Pseudomonadota bacterium]
MKRILIPSVLIGMCAAVVSAQAWAEDANAFQPPCASSPSWSTTSASYRDFDFLLGEWQVYDRETGALRGLDTVTADLKGCVLKQHFQQLDDTFSQGGAPYRLHGRSMAGIGPSGKWRQIWVDNVGSNLMLTGEKDEAGNMVMSSEWYDYPAAQGPVRMRNIWHWSPQTDGTIRNWGVVQTGDEMGPQRQYFDVIYQPNKPGGAQSSLRKAKPLK